MKRILKTWSWAGVLGSFCFAINSHPPAEESWVGVLEWLRGIKEIVSAEILTQIENRAFIEGATIGLVFLPNVLFHTYRIIT